jgi:hypothetical protein
MSKANNSDLCNCDCHSAYGLIMHVVSCCLTCKRCGESIRRERHVNHEMYCDKPQSVRGLFYKLIEAARRQ